jgi:hypothetical protein
MTRSSLQVLIVVALVTACSSKAPAQVVPPTPAPADTAGDEAGHLPPIGFGSLSQDLITLRLRSGSIEIRFVPLDERVLRLLTPDTYQALQSTLQQAQPQIDSVAKRRGIRTPGVAVVSFFGLAPNSRFDPQVLIIEHRNRQIRPIAVLPSSPTFSAQQLDVREHATGIFLFEEPLPVTEPFTLSYLDTRSTEWERRLQRLDAERARIQSNSGANTPTGTP